MGCTYSAAAADGGDGYTFRVYNVDSQGVELNPGKIKVAASDLILYQKGKEPIHWPLRCLRRYGFDEELFSFESGRRCTTGPGIYAFKCRHAEDLFIMVQESIQRAGEEDQLRVNGGSGSSGGSHGMFSHAGRPSSHPATFAEPHDQHGFMRGSSPGSTLQMRLMNSSPQQHQYINGTVATDSPQYMNTGRGPRLGAFQIDESAPLIEFMNRPGQRGGSRGRAQVNYADLDLPSSMENLLDEDGQGAVHNMPRYVNSANRLSMPVDLPSALGPEDLSLQAADSDVFLPDPEDPGMNPTYINVNIDEPSPPLTRYDEAAGGSATGVSGAGGGTAASGGGGGGLTVDSAAGYTPNYANLTISNNGPYSAGWQQKQHTFNYIQLDLNQASSDCLGAGCGPSLSPTSPTSNASVPECSSYAKIDFDRTKALSDSTRAGTEGEDEPGARKTRHNSTIGV